MRIAVHLPRCRPDATAEATRTFARVAEQLGYARVWAWDRPDGDLDAVAAIAFAAGSTDRVPLGAVVRSGGRAPGDLARALASLYDLGAGRVTVGIDRDGSVDTVTDALPTNHVGGPLLLSAARPAELREVARRADGWLVDDRVPPDAVGTTRAQLRELAAAAGRDADTLAVVALATVDLDGPATPPRPWRLSGPPARIGALLDDLRRSGVDEVVLAVAGRCGLDEALHAFAAVADAAGLDSADALRGTGSA